jgi:hypothetical protein
MIIQILPPRIIQGQRMITGHGVRERPDKKTKISQFRNTADL